MKNLRRPNLTLTLFLVVTVSSTIILYSPAPNVAHAAVGGEYCSPSANMITWHPVEVECPLCKTKNIFLQWGSYGNYIYQYPTKYQLIFWPYTDGPAWYSCKKCRLTTFMEDFRTVPKEKIEDLRQMLLSVNLPAQKERSDKDSMHPPYLEIPTSDRLAVAEKVYQVLGIQSDQFWSHFYRVQGYHLERNGKQAEADKARQKALEFNEKILADAKDEGLRKELLYISAAMQHFLRDDAQALKTLEKARHLKHSDAKLNAEDNKGYDEYLSKLISEYIEMLKEGKGPRDLKS